MKYACLVSHHILSYHIDRYPYPYLHIYPYPFSIFIYLSYLALSKPMPKPMLKPMPRPMLKPMPAPKPKPKPTLPYRIIPYHIKNPIAPCSMLQYAMLCYAML